MMSMLLAGKIKLAPVCNCVTSPALRDVYVGVRTMFVTFTVYWISDFGIASVASGQQLGGAEGSASVTRYCGVTHYMRLVMFTRS